MKFGPNERYESRESLAAHEKSTNASLVRSYGWYVALGSAVALAFPSDILSSNPTLGFAVDSVASLVPAVDRVARQSSFPEVTRLFTALMWVLYVVPTLQFATAVRLRPPPPSLKQTLTLLVFVPLVLFLLLYFSFVFFEMNAADVTYQRGRGRAAFTYAMEHRLGLAIFGNLTMVASSIFVALTLKFLWSRKQRD